MILSRITRAVREQNWLAVAIEFVIVILGVVIGFQITAWNAERAELIRAEGYLERILADIETDIELYEVDRRFRLAVIENGMEALAATGPTGNLAGDWEIIRAHFNASQTSGRPTIDTTFAELTSSGDIALIMDVDLRSALSRYYTVTSVRSVLQEWPAYREHVRGLIPADIQAYLWRHCYAADGDSDQRFLDCDPPADAGRIAETVERITQSAELRDQLNYWMSTQDVALLLLEGRRQIVEDLRARISALLDGDFARPAQ